MKKARALLLGTGPEAPYHPLAAVEPELFSIFSARFDVSASVDQDVLLAERLRGVGLCICYVDAWKDAPRPDRISELLAWLSAGGGLLVIHNGISLQADPSFARLIGARFLRHADIRSLRFEAAAGHPLSPDIPLFTIEEEPYQFEPVAGGSTVPFLFYESEGRLFPAGWTGQLGAGRFAYLMPGHDVRSFRDPAFRDVIARCAGWVTGQPPQERRSDGP